MTTSRALILALSSCLLPACGGGDSSTSTLAMAGTAGRGIQQVILTPPANEVRPGWQAEVRLSVVDGAGGPAPFTGPVAWASSDPAIATATSPTATSSSTVRALAPGRVTISATVDGVIGRTEIEVRPDAPYRFSVLSAGEAHTCAAGNGGPAVCWGSNARGQLGNGTAAGSAVPVAVSGLSRVDTVVAGAGFSCAGSPSRTDCWGLNASGQLGDGSTSDRWAPDSRFPVDADNADLPPILSAGSSHACLIVNDGYFLESYCWGDNGSGQLGDGTTTTRSRPTFVNAGRFRTISAGGQHTCGVWNGAAYCWGANDSGQLGDGTYAARTIPVFAARGIAIDSIAAGARHTCAVSTSNDVYCWGDGSNGRLGTGSNDSSAVPLAVVGGLKFKFVAAGSAHTCGLTLEDIAYCWGANGNGQLGDGSTTDRGTPVAVAPNPAGQGDALRFESIAVGGRHTCGVTTNQAAYCWGANSDGQLGNGSRSDSAVPVKVLHPS